MISESAFVRVAPELVLRPADHGGFQTWMPPRFEVYHAVFLKVLHRIATGPRFGALLDELESWFDVPDELAGKVSRRAHLAGLIGELVELGMVVCGDGEPLPARPTRPISSVEDATHGGPNWIRTRFSLLLRPSPAGLVACGEGVDLLLDDATLDVIGMVGGVGCSEGEIPDVVAPAMRKLLGAQLLLRVAPTEAGKGQLKAQRWKAALRAVQPDKTPVFPVFASSRTYSPLGIGLVVAHARSYGSLSETYDFRPLMPTSDALAEGALALGPGVALFSDYVWCVKEHLEASERLKQASPHTITIHGGPSVPKYDEALIRFFEDNPHIDVGIIGEGESALAEVLERLAPHVATIRAGHAIDLSILLDVPGVAVRTPSGTVERAPARERTKELDRFPSPYLSGVFDAEDVAEWDAVIIETNRGCPYQCTFCDWGSATLQKIRLFSIERLTAELEWIAKQKTPVLWIADANFGIFERDIEIAQMIAATREKYGFPREVKMAYAKNATARIAEILRIFLRAGIPADAVISIQTTDEQTLKTIRRSNIKNERYDELLQIFRKENLPLGTDLIYALPGSTFESFQRDLQTYFDKDVVALAYPCVVLPGSPMADPAYMEEHGIVTERIAGLDHITSTNSFTRRDWERMHRLNRLIHCYVNYGALRLMLHYLQRDHGILGISFLVALMDDMDEEPTSLLMNRCMIEYYRFRLVPPGGWRWLYEELKAYVARKYGLDPEAAGLATAWEVQEAVMPEEGRRLPLELHTAHDIAVYIREQVWARPTHEPSIKKLGEYGPSVLPISDPDGKCQASRTFVNPQLFHSTTLELASPVARSQWTHTLWNDNWQAPPRVAGIF